MEELSSCCEEMDWESFRKNLMEAVLSSLDSLGQVWADIGIQGQMLQDRCAQVLEHYQDLAERMQQEDSALRQRLLHTVHKQTETLEEYCRQLDLPVPEVGEGSLLVLKQQLAEKLDKVSSVRRVRLDRLEKLREAEAPLCCLLELNSHTMASERPVPTEEELNELGQHVDMLSAEKVQRYKKYCTYRNEVLRLLQTLQKSVHVPLEQEVLVEGSDGSPTSLSHRRLSTVKNLSEQLKREVEEAKSLLEELTRRLNFLWDFLEEDNERRQHFMRENGHCGQKGLAAVRQEISRCEELRRANIGSFVGKLRQELALWWEKCQASEEERNAFQPHLQSENFTEELLDVHERQVEKWREHYQKFEGLFVKAEKIEELFRKALDLQHQMMDPNRLNNRGGRLLLEERERKKLLLQIPKMERELLEMCRRFEGQVGRTFLIAGLRPEEYLREKRELLMQDKENEKLQRKQRKEELSCVTPRKQGAKGCTPFKTPGNSVRGMTLRSPAFKSPAKGLTGGTPHKSRRQLLKSPHLKMVAASGGSRRCTRNSPYAKPLSQNQEPTPVTSDPRMASMQSITSYTSFERPLSKSANKRSTMNNSAHKVLGSKVTPLFTNSGTKRRRLSNIKAQQSTARGKNRLAAADIPLLF